MKYHEYIKDYFQRELSQSAIAYLRNGLELFHSARRRPDNPYQTAIGNLGISIEIMLKTLLARNNPVLLFDELQLPLELKALFSSPSYIPEEFNWRIYDVELRSFAYKTVKLDNCIKMFYLFFPQEKQALKPYFEFLSRCRNASVHASLPSFKKYDLERVAWLALRLFRLFESLDIFIDSPLYLNKEDKEFFASYEEERVKRVRQKIEKAAEKSKNFTGEVVIEGDLEVWEEMIADCPVCCFAGVLAGYTDIAGEITDEDGSADVYLKFFASSYRCEACGLQLDDLEELRLAGIPAEYIRDEDPADFYEDDYDDYRDYF